jgi:hypothetical protein
MTQQYLAGELSVLLAQLHTAAENQAYAGEIARLRQRAETAPITELPSVAARALQLTDAACWESLSTADITAFAYQAAIGAQLREFGICSRLLTEA